MKPRLYVDIDGVIIGHYGGAWQIRPYVRTLLGWAEEHFRISWLSYSGYREIVPRALYSKYRQATWPESGEIGTLGKLQSIVHEDDGTDWIMLEDEPPTIPAREYLKEREWSDRWIVVPESGCDVLLELRFTLEEWLKSRRMIVPVEWLHLDKDETFGMSTRAIWEGYKSPRSSTGQST